MNIETFQKRIDDRVQEMVDKAIRVFKGEILTALDKLLMVNNQRIVEGADNEKVLAILISKLPQSEIRWPKVIWERRREQLEKEIMERLDVVARTLRSNPQNINQSC